MVKLRLRRAGKKKSPLYKLVAADIRAPRDGAYLEAIGSYNPNVNPMELKFDEARVFHWLKKGAEPTNTVRSLFQRTGLWLRWSLMKSGADEGKIQGLMERWQMAQADRGKRESERKARRAERKKKAAATAAEAAPAAPATPAAPAAPPAEQAPAQ